MINHTLKNQGCKLLPGTVVKGKWYQNVYEILETLGYGATGTVYLAKSKQGLVALKMSENSMSITSEVNVLRHFSKVQGSTLGPSLLDVDDYVTTKTSQSIPFYVMEYMKGSSLLSFLQKKGEEWLGVLMIQLLSDLEKLHQAGWVFGDLKPENLIVVGPPSKIRWFDVGGTTYIGRSVKEYTEFFDRGYWGLGSRKADPAYDLFAVAMIMMNCAYPKRFSKKSDQPIVQLSQAIDAKPPLIKYKSLMINALLGKYQNASEMRVDLIDQLRNKKNLFMK